mmetsp:Transcript_62331/g.167243  ORF Transcript_62331/g.167243 Transcript_62331/m.167243 type:complete len:82 (+) Transcript_62331:317-562(+)
MSIESGGWDLPKESRRIFLLQCEQGSHLGSVVYRGAGQCSQAAAGTLGFTITTCDSEGLLLSSTGIPKKFVDSNGLRSVHN